MGGGGATLAFFHQENEGDHAGRADGEEGNNVEIGELGALANELLIDAALSKGARLGRGCGETSAVLEVAREAIALPDELRLMPLRNMERRSWCS